MQRFFGMQIAIFFAVLKDNKIDKFFVSLYEERYEPEKL